MNNEFNEENKNSTNKILIAIIIILILALGGLSYYTFFVRNKKVDKSNPVVEPTNPAVEPTEPINKEVFTDEKLMKEINKYDLKEILESYVCSVHDSLVYNKNKIVYDSINDEEKLHQVLLYISIKQSNNSIDNVWFTTFAVKDENMRNDDNLTDEEKTFYESNGFQRWMYISDFNKYALDRFKYISPLKDNVLYEAGKCSDRMKTHNDKLFFGAGCGGFCDFNPVFTSLNKKGDIIELKATNYAYDFSKKFSDELYTFKYNGTIYDLIEIEILKKY